MVRCLHSHCPLGNGIAAWDEVVDLPELKAGRARAALLADLNADFSLQPTAVVAPAQAPTTNAALLTRLLVMAPCLVNQMDVNVTSNAIVHLYELTLNSRITVNNVEAAFYIQHPGRGVGYAFPPVRQFAGAGGTIMELLCSEVLTSAGIPGMAPGAGEWPVWNMPGHIVLNNGKMSELKALGDILIPCAPTNLLISVKSEKARERLLYSANSIEGIGFGFFNQPDEFWTDSRMQLYKRMGFSAIYMPGVTVDAIHRHVGRRNTRRLNVYGTELYRPITDFGTDMNRVVGKSAFAL